MPKHRNTYFIVRRTNFKPRTKIYHTTLSADLAWL